MGKLLISDLLRTWTRRATGDNIYLLGRVGHGCCGGAVGRIEDLLDGIDSSFEGAIGREEEIAANDLAVSFLQGRSLREVLSAGGALTVIDDERVAAPVTVLGNDYLVTEDPLRLVPMAHAVVRTDGDHEPPQIVPGSWVEAARGWRGRRVEIVAGPWTGIGLLALAAVDHLVIESNGRVVIPNATVRSLNLSRGD